MVVDVLEEVLLSVLISVLLAVFVVRFVSSASSVHVDVSKADARAAKDVGAAGEDERRERVGNGDNEAVEEEKVGFVEEEPVEVEEEGNLELVDRRGDLLEVEVGKLKEEEGVSSDVIDDPDLEVKGATFEQGNAADTKEEVGGDAVPEDGNGVVRDEDDEWEGIEKSSLQDRFDSLTRFVASAAGEVLLVSAGGDTLLQLYALHKVATEGPCYEPPPSILKSSARAKWNAWQKLGTMNPEEAMEQYILLLNKSIPGLDEKEDYKGEVDHHGSSAMKTTDHLNSSPAIELTPNAERKLEINTNADLDDGDGWSVTGCLSSTGLMLSTYATWLGANTNAWLNC